MERRLKVTEDMFRQTTESPSHFLMALVIKDGKRLPFFSNVFPGILGVVLGLWVFKQEKKKSTPGKNKELHTDLLGLHMNGVKCRSCKGSRIHEQRKTYGILQD